MCYIRHLPEIVTRPSSCVDLLLCLNALKLAGSPELLQWGVHWPGHLWLPGGHTAGALHWLLSEERTREGNHFTDLHTDSDPVQQDLKKSFSLLSVSCWLTSTWLMEQWQNSCRAKGLQLCVRTSKAYNILFWYESFRCCDEPHVTVKAFLLWNDFSVM